MNKKLQQLKGTKKKRLQATKVSVEGRGVRSRTCRGEFATRALTLRLELPLLSCNLQFCLDPNVLCCYK